MKMGFNTVLVLMNDAQHAIENDINIGKKISFACNEFDHKTPGILISASYENFSHGNAISVVSM